MENKQAGNKIVAWLNREVRDYVYGPRRMFAPLHIVFVVLVVVFASFAGVAFAQCMVPIPADGAGTFVDGYAHRYMFDVGAIAAILALVLVRRVFRALCAAYVRRLDMNDAIRGGEVLCGCTGCVKQSLAPTLRAVAVSNGDYAGDAGDRERGDNNGGDA